MVKRSWYSKITPKPKSALLWSCLLPYSILTVFYNPPADNHFGQNVLKFCIPSQLFVVWSYYVQQCILLLDLRGTCHQCVSENSWFACSHPVVFLIRYWCDSSFLGSKTYCLFQLLREGFVSSWSDCSSCMSVSLLLLPANHDPLFLCGLLTPKAFLHAFSVSHRKDTHSPISCPSWRAASMFGNPPAVWAVKTSVTLVRPWLCSCMWTCISSWLLPVVSVHVHQLKVLSYADILEIDIKPTDVHLSLISFFTWDLVLWNCSIVLKVPLVCISLHFCQLVSFTCILSSLLCISNLKLSIADWSVFTHVYCAHEEETHPFLAVLDCQAILWPKAI